MELNLKELKRLTMKVTLNDDTVVNVKIPTKHIFDELKSAKSADPNEYYRMAFTILNHNTENKKFTKDEIETMFDYQDVVMLVVSYGNFCREIANSKN